MKTTIYDLLGMIKDGKAPKKIIYDSKLWEYDNQNKDYFTNHYDGTEWLFDEYLIATILNDEVEILETTITYKQDTRKIEKLKFDMSINFIDQFTDKINEIIDKFNGE